MISFDHGPQLLDMFENMPNITYGNVELTKFPE